MINFAPHLLLILCVDFIFEKINVCQLTLPVKDAPPDVFPVVQYKAP